jgi:poly(3-hydroxybutyrate) depolymerase
VTISGISAGSFMTNQMFIAFSETFKGAGMVAGGPYQILESVYGPSEHNKVDSLSFFAKIKSVSNPIL